MSNLDIIEAELWDHYSGLPNPMWYQYKSEQQDDEEEDTDDNVSTTIVVEQDKA